MLCKISVRFSENLVVVGSLKYLARTNVAPLIQDMAAIPLHRESYSCSCGVKVRAISKGMDVPASPKWGNRPAVPAHLLNACS